MNDAGTAPDGDAPNTVDARTASDGMASGDARALVDSGVDPRDAAPVDDGGNNGNGRTYCSPVQIQCVSADALTFCDTADQSGCSSAWYTYEGKDYPCASCTDCQGAYDEVVQICQGTVGACDDLHACCMAMTDASTQQGCLNSWNAYNSIEQGSYSCKRLLDQERSQGLCP